MKRFFRRVFPLLMVLTTGCGWNDPNQPAQPATFADLRTGIQARFMAGDTLVSSKDKLLGLLPEHLNEKSSGQANAASFSGRKFSFTQAKKSYALSPAQYLSATLSDYAVDTNAFIYLFRQYQEAEDSLRISAPRNMNNSVFGWISNHPQTGYTHLEAGFNYRYHLSVETNAEDPEAIMNQLLESIIQAENQ